MTLRKLLVPPRTGFLRSACRFFASTGHKGSLRSACRGFASTGHKGFVLGMAALLAGCSASEAPANLVPVTGHVSLDGKPAAGVTVLLTPLTGTTGFGGYAVTDENGAFTITHRSQQPGCEPGSYGVTFSKLTQPDGSPIPPGASRGEVGIVEQLPAAYTEFDENNLRESLQVGPQGATADFHLQSKPPALPRR